MQWCHSAKIIACPYYIHLIMICRKNGHLLWDLKRLRLKKSKFVTEDSTLNYFSYQPMQTTVLVVISQLISWTKETRKKDFKYIYRHGPMDFFSILLSCRCTTLGLTGSCHWWQQAHCTERVAKKYLSTWKTERNQLKRMPITSDISANTKEIFIYEMNVWAVMVWLGCPFRQLMLQ